MQSSEATKKKIGSLEGVRGCAALVVFLCHLLTSIDGMPKFMLLNFIGNMGTDAVIVFFLLSGFVISASTKPQTTAKVYIQKRLLRILPIFVFALSVSYGVEYYLHEAVQPLVDVLGNFLFLGSLQAFIVPLVPTNGPLWSLGCEMFFYILFFLTIVEKRFWPIWMLCALIAVIVYPIFIAKTGVIAYLIFNFSFSIVWLLGVVAEKIRNKYNFDETSVVFSCAIALAFSRVDFISTYYDVYRFICFAIFLVPAFIYLTSSSKNLILFPRWLLILIWLVASYLLWIGNSGQSAKLIIIGMLPAFFLLKALGFVDVPAIERLLTKISWTGHYSYALYAVHFPLILLVNTINAGWQFKFITAVLASAVAAYFLEDIFQKYTNKVVVVAK